MTVALTIHQPWASLIAHGIKGWETRPHPPAGWPGIPEGTRRQPGCRVDPGALVLIHAAKQWANGWLRWYDPEDAADLDRMDVFERLRVQMDEDVDGSYTYYPWKSDLPLGAVVATARITDVVPIVSQPSLDPERFCYLNTFDESRAPLWLHDKWAQWTDISDQLPYGDWRPGRWAWRLSDVRKLDEPVSGYMKPEPHNDGGGLPCRREWCAHDVPREAVPVRGRQGVWRPDPALVEACGAAS